MNSALLHVSNLTARFTNAAAPVLTNITFDIADGEIVGIVGESGSGKSVTAQSIMRLLADNQIHYDTTSRINFAEHNLLGATPQTMQRLCGKDMAMIFQEPLSALNPLHAIGKQIAEAIRIHQPLTAVQTQNKVLELLAEVELAHFKDRLDAYPHQLSGGERQRIMIAMAIANKPRLLIADEPTTALDVHIQEQVIALILRLQQKHGMAVLFISHDLTLVQRICQRVIIMKQGEIVEQGTADKIFFTPKHPYTQKLLASSPQGKPIPLPEQSKEILRLEKLSVDFVLKKNWLGKPTAIKTGLHDINFSLTQGETLGIVGESGSGKSTLAQTILRLLPAQGSLIYDNQEISTRRGQELKQLRQEVQCVFQDPFASLNPRLNVGFIISEGLRIHHPHLTEQEIQQKVSAILLEVGLNTEAMHRYPHEFSGGQRQRISIARAMILEPKLVLLDEPTSALDLTLQTQILTLLKSFQERLGTSYIFISHDLRVIKSIAHNIIVLKSGNIVERGTWDMISTAPQSDYTKLLLNAAFPKTIQE